VMTLAAFFNPLAAMAIEASSIACSDWAKGKVLEAAAPVATTPTAPSSGAKTSGSLTN